MRKNKPDNAEQLTPSNGYLKCKYTTGSGTLVLMQCSRYLCPVCASVACDGVVAQLTRPLPSSDHGITVLYSDVSALKEDWLNDTARIALVRPTIVALMVQSARLRDIESALPDFRNDTHIFIPVNDSVNAGKRADSGSHWSLLLVSRLDGVAFHYDSMNDHNEPAARACVDRLSRVLRQPLRFYRIVDMPQQTNSSDCGVIVCILMRHLLVKKLLNANAREKVGMGLTGKQIDTIGGRKEMLRTIEQMRKEGERRRSTGTLPLTIRSGNEPPYID
ncbi:hypothetical protein GGTG_09193 [Gaeumannomyces tritici R3-111a-1]|uniref:Ubiquitin-like protease family profile domain-containing protein n=1 Tax=Gaeumannomyces tritici (strain R3-111a-1) TaxID=644352 RepID=J3P6Q1_GAET3|nr:hypothetical protein GGTG_09193 [Gaeumannomyces tritici R3-111a-1]EJT72327.1 hypothetical protein GGTG_09193 [Gaeumannomyces tritici R3-111a-1]